MTYERYVPNQADPASHQPSGAGTARCASCGNLGCTSSYCSEERVPDPTDRFLRMMNRLADIGMAQAERLVAQSSDVPEAEPDAQPTATPAPDRAGLILLRITRELRLCMALAVRFHADRLAREKQVVTDRETAEKQRKSRLKDQLERLVKDAIDHDILDRIETLREMEPERFDEEEDEGECEAERAIRAFGEFELKPALYERLKAADIERDLGRCSMGELMSRVCRDIEIEPNWNRWAQDDWALEEARLKIPGSPFVVRAEEPDEAHPAEPSG